MSHCVPNLSSITRSCRRSWCGSLTAWSVVLDALASVRLRPPSCSASRYPSWIGSPASNPPNSKSPPACSAPGTTRPPRTPVKVTAAGRMSPATTTPSLSLALWAGVKAVHAKGNTASTRRCPSTPAGSDRESISWCPKSRVATEWRGTAAPSRGCFCKMIPINRFYLHPFSELHGAEVSTSLYLSCCRTFYI